MRNAEPSLASRRRQSEMDILIVQGRRGSAGIAVGGARKRERKKKCGSKPTRSYYQVFIFLSLAFGFTFIESAFFAFRSRAEHAVCVWALYFRRDRRMEWRVPFFFFLRLFVPAWTRKSVRNFPFNWPECLPSLVAMRRVGVFVLWLLFYVFPNLTVPTKRLCSSLFKVSRLVYMSGFLFVFWPATSRFALCITTLLSLHRRPLFLASCSARSENMPDAGKMPRCLLPAMFVGGNGWKIKMNPCSFDFLCCPCGSHPVFGKIVTHAAYSVNEIISVYFAQIPAFSSHFS